MTMKTIRIFAVLSPVLLLISCMPDRMPPAPIEHDRPEFVRFAPEDSAAYNVPLRDPIRIMFNEPMMVSSFKDNFIVQTSGDVVAGTFSESDSTVIFTPTEDMQTASYYTATVLGGVKDKNGNSLSLDPQWSASTWFFTAGKYSENGFPLVFIADRTGDLVYRVGNFEQYMDNNPNIIQPRGMAFTPDGQSLLIVSKQLEGKIYLVDPATFGVVQEITVGVGPENIAVTPDKIFVVNVSERTISVLSFPGYSLLATIEFSDGFRPRDIAYHPQQNRIYVSNNVTSQSGRIKVIDADTYQELDTIENALSGLRTEKLLVSTDGNWLIVQQERTDFIRFIDAQSNQVADSILIPVRQNKDMDVFNNYLYVCNAKLDGTGSIYKYDVMSRALMDSVSFTSGCDGIAVAPFGEILYVTTPTDSTAHVVEIETLNVIRTVKISSNISKLVVSPNNY